jgi:ribulose-phosphate 3-epimerase
VAWQEWIRGVEVEPSLYAADFARLGEQIDELLAAGTRVFHYDVGDGHFVEPIIVGPIVLESIAGRIHHGGAFVDVHLMVESPERHFQAFHQAGADSVTFHYEAVEDVRAAAEKARNLGLGVGVAVKPRTAVEEVAEAVVAAGVDLVLCMSIEPGYSGQQFMPDAFERLRRLRAGLPEAVQLQVDGGVNAENIRAARQAGANLLVAATAVFHAADPAAAYRGLADAAR